jgi:hypothetical protein
MMSVPHTGAAAATHAQKDSTASSGLGTCEAPADGKTETQHGLIWPSACGDRELHLNAKGLPLEGRDTARIMLST